VHLEGDRISEARIALSGVAPQPVRVPAAEALLAQATPGPEAIAAAAAQVAADVDPSSDLHGSAAYRRHVAGVLVRRTLEQATQRAATQPTGGAR